MEDRTEWSGFFAGEKGKTIIEIGFENSGEEVNDIKTYIPIQNSSLSLSWYKMDSGRYEIVVYVG
jgi:hypothetical protein